MIDGNSGVISRNVHAQQSMQGERRVITVLFCDVTGSTSMAGQMDAEEWAELMNDAFAHMIQPIYRYEGTVARLLGDGLLAFFGAPFAHEDDPARAILAGLDIIERIRRFSDAVRRDYGLDFDVRVGINTGAVVGGNIGTAEAIEYTAMGDAINIAARMEQTAQPGTLQISLDTYRQTAPLFDFEALGEISVKGKNEPISTYRVIAAKQEPGSLRGLQGMPAQLIGRDTEMERLQKIVANLLAGRGHIVCLIGEAGLGKSRIITEVHEEWQRLRAKEQYRSL